MRIIELVELLTKQAQAYVKDGHVSVKRNSHMNNYDGPEPDPELVKAIVADYLNFIAGRSGMDLALYTSDL